jgi:hypothetical protein
MALVVLAGVSAWKSEVLTAAAAVLSTEGRAVTGEGGGNRTGDCVAPAGESDPEKAVLLLAGV